MGKTITVASKFTEEENDRIEIYAEIHGMSKSQVLHEFAIKGMAENPVNEHGVRTVDFKFLDNYAYFWKDKIYHGTIHGDEVSIRFGGEWKNYKLADIPVEVIDG